jgi:antitoxin component HigA of HigAB toxin-antitoxin module
MTINPIRTDEDLRATFQRLERIYQADEGSPKTDEGDLLVTLIEIYESASPVKRLTSNRSTLRRLISASTRRMPHFFVPSQLRPF